MLSQLAIHRKFSCRFHTIILKTFGNKRLKSLIACISNYTSSSRHRDIHSLCLNSILFVLHFADCISRDSIHQRTECISMLGKINIVKHETNRFCLVHRLACLPSLCINFNINMERFL